ncbi:COP23 domain-containing protein [Fischerella sp. PCC 9605]|uniref:COP23 domain-containing protein n=1 Tax=Fischerella sp. PCC 9605 TaxID=1173024 RepID=UPI00047A32A3|nr:COP23 domain-containing protein [Fischerella sp. PCC 9605]
MQLRLFGQILPGVATTSVTSALALAAIAITTSNQPSYAGGNKFSCAKLNGVPVTMVRTSRGNETFIRWKDEYFSKSIDRMSRCQAVTDRFQRYYDNGNLFITSRENVNNYPVLCIANRKGAPCTSDNILITLKPGTDIGRVLKQMLDFRRGVGTEPIELSGSQYLTYEDGDLYLDVKQLVDSADSEDNNQSSVTKTPQSAPVEPRF